MNQARTYNDLKRANFRLIEKELYHYKARKAELAEMKAVSIDGGGRSTCYSGPGDPTVRKVVKLYIWGVILEIEK